MTRVRYLDSKHFVVVQSQIEIYGEIHLGGEVHRT
jgi:hypothetical protein